VNRTAVTLAIAAALVGCPLPQPLPEYSTGAVTPPRIVVDNSDPEAQIKYPGTVVPVPAICATPPVFTLDAQIRDSNTIESIEARWFVNYDPLDVVTAHWEDYEKVGPVPSDPTLRDITPWEFRPYSYHHDRFTPGSGDVEGALHIVELVVSNAFYTGAGESLPAVGEPLPFRSPANDFEVQVYRWVFLNVQASAEPCAPGNLLCAQCPSNP
jgi:hypothetical protein